jgi:hypothetical protein
MEYFVGRRSSLATAGPRHAVWLATSQESRHMLDLLAHITEREVPSFWLTALIGFVAGVGVTFAMMFPKLKK